jgi:GAF domain-containing protein
MTYPLPDPIARCNDVQVILGWLLQKGMDLSHTRLGNVQLMNWNAGCLEIKLQSGFDSAFLDFFARVRIEHGSACARALRCRQAIVIEDITADEEFKCCREIVSQAGVRAVQSTPMISSSGAILGIVSTHFPVCHRPTKMELHNLQHTAQVAANAIVRARAHQCSSAERIDTSMALLRDARDVIARAETALARWTA